MATDHPTTIISSAWEGVRVPTHNPLTTSLTLLTPEQAAERRRWEQDRSDRIRGYDEKGRPVEYVARYTG